MRWYGKARSFLVDVKGELKRTSWPSRKEVVGTTTVVVITVLIFAAFLFVVDTALYTLVDLIFRAAG
ncbi:MAG: preprotein translocase subunit SecE [Acidobacteriota bacterium]